MANSFGRISNILTSCLSRIFKKFKWQILIYGVLLLLSFLTGIFTCVSYLGKVEVSNLINKYIYEFLTRDKSVISYFFTMSIWFALFAICAVVFRKSKFFIFIDIIACMLALYIAGFDIVILCTCLGFFGAVISIISFGIVGMFFYCILILLITMISNREFVTSSCNNFDYKNYFVLVLIGVILQFLIILLFSPIHLFVIVE